MEKSDSEKEKSRKIFFLVLGAILIFLSYLLIKDFIIPLISAFILAYLVKPIYDILKEKVGEDLSAIACLAIIFLIVIIPLSILAGEITRQASLFINDPATTEFFGKISQTTPLEGFNLDLASLTSKAANFTIDLIASAIKQIPSMIIGLIIIFMGVFFILKNWDSLAKQLTKYIPFHNKDKIAKEISESTKNILYGSVLVAAIEFVIALIGFYFLGIEFFILLSLLIFFLAFFPGLGPTIVWVPVALYYAFTQNPLLAIGTTILGLILSVGVDAIARGKILGHKAKINVLVMFVGIIGGISLFGIFGFIIGPLILVYTLKLMNELLDNTR